MEDQYKKNTLPAEYHENALYLLSQSPKVMYAYWELSPGLKNTLSEKKMVQIRLNIAGNGICQVYDIGLTEKSCYFKNVVPGLSYNCEIGTVNEDNIFLPLLRSSTVSAPQDLPGGESSGKANSASSAVLTAKASDSRHTGG